MKNKKYLPLIIFTISLLISVSFNTFILGIHHCQESDGLMYSKQAKNIMEYIFSTSEARYPLFPIFLSILYEIFGDCLFFVRFTISVLGALNCLLIYYIAKNLSGQRLAIYSGLIATAYPNLFYWSGFLLTETISITFFLTSIYLMLKYIRNQQKIEAAFVGMFLALSALSKGMFIIVFPLLLVWIIYFYWNVKKIMFTAICYIFLPLIIVLSPWTIRNYVILNKFVPIATNGGSGFYGANNPLSLNKDIRGLGQWDSHAAEKLLPETKNMSVVESDRYKYRKGLEWVVHSLKKEPLKFLELELWKVQKAWFPRIWGRSSNAKIVFSFSYLLVSVLGIFGIILSLKERRKYSLFYVILLSHLLITLIFFGGMRFRAPFDPILIIFSAMAIDYIYRTSKSKVQSILNRCF